MHVRLGSQQAEKWRGRDRSASMPMQQCLLPPPACLPLVSTCYLPLAVFSRYFKDDFENSWQRTLGFLFFIIFFSLNFFARGHEYLLEREREREGEITPQQSVVVLPSLLLHCFLLSGFLACLVCFSSRWSWDSNCSRTCGIWLPQP